ncbi:MAG: SDR family oxidoreductase [Verrucomicrobiota bacterium]
MIIVTGASRGLGRSVAERLISSGREVLSLSRTSEGVPGDSVTCDVSDYEAVKAVAQSLRKEKREIEGLVNAAGIASMNLAVTTPPSMTQKLIQTNLAGTIHCCQLFAPLMIRKKAGSIINFSTIAVTLGLKGESIYAASKAGVEGFSRAFAREMADFDIRVNCISPRPIKTDLLKGVSDEQIDAIVAQQILPKLFLPDDIADLCEFLLGPQSQSLSGQVLKVGGA